MFLRLSNLFLLCFLCVQLSAQEYKVMKWGKISQEEYAMTAYEADKEAPAVILQDVGEINFHNSDKIKIVFSRHKRIKVFDKSALDEGNIFIPYYSKKGFEKFNNLQVQVFSPTGEKQKVSKKTFITEKLSKNWSAKKIFIPNVQKGSIIEVRYALSTENFFQLHDWEFQDELPVRLSQFEITIPPYFDYSAISRFPKTPFKDERYEKPSVFGGATDGAKDACRLVVVHDIPAIKDEPYCNTIENYKGLMRFQLQGYQFPGRNYEQVVGTWEGLAKDFYDSDYFGKQFYKNRRYDKLWDACKTAVNMELPTKEKAEAIRQFVAKKIQWNGKNRRFTTGKSIDEAFEKGEGSSSDVNLAVVAMLREAGLNAWPLMVSTQTHGDYIFEYPLMDQFNSVLAYVEDEGGFIVDATDIVLGVGIAHQNTYNRAAWIANPNAPTWIDMKRLKAKRAFVGEFTLHTDGTAEAAVQLQCSNHAAVDLRNALEEDGAESALKSIFSEQVDISEIADIDLQDEKEYTKPLQAKFNIELDGMGEESGDLFFFSPVVVFDFLENPFTALKRLYPVNLAHGLSEQYIAKIKFPEGYVLEEELEPIKMSLSNNGGRFFMTTSPMEGGAQIVARFSINQLDFMPEEYAGLREFFERISTKLSEQIVLKKVK